MPWSTLPLVIWWPTLLSVVALLGAPGSLAAGTLPARLQIEAGRETVVLTLSCPTPAPALAVTIDEAPVSPLGREELGQTAPAVALIIERSAAMGAAGTPHSTRLEDAILLASMLRELAPPGSSFAVVTLDSAARVALPPTADGEASVASLAALEPGPAPRPTLPVFGEALALAQAQLATAPAGPRAVVAFLAGGFPAAAPDEAVSVELPLLLVDHGPGGPAPGGLAPFAAGLDAGYAPYASADIADLPAMGRAVQQQLKALVVPGTQLRLTLPAVAGGPHLLRVEGCGAPLVAAFDGPQALPALPIASATLVGLALGLAAGRLLRQRGRQERVEQAAPDDEARLLAALAITTARRTGGPLGPAGLRAIVWDGQSRRSIALAGRHWTVGSDPACVLVVAGEGVEPLHARLSLAGEGVTITAIEGSTVLGLHGRPLIPGAQAPLAEGELVVVGKAVRLMLERALVCLDDEP